MQNFFILGDGTLSLVSTAGTCLQRCQWAIFLMSIGSFLVVQKVVLYVRGKYAPSQRHVMISFQGPFMNNGEQSRTCMEHGGQCPLKEKFCMVLPP